jgi:indole-3-glycerol phosphate synthase
VTILDEILATKREEVATAKLRVPASEMAERASSTTDAPRGFRAALRDAQPPAVIAELKRRSPSKGLIREDFDPVVLARAYDEGGAAAISVLTDETYFGGHLEYLAKVRAAVSLPLLRKDFVVEAYQIDEARVGGADAVLLIAAALPAEEIGALHEHARRLGLDVLVEVHDARELEVALAAGADLVGVNNRDLRTFETDLGTTERVAAALPPGRDVLLVAESGIETAADVRRLLDHGAEAFLVGESLMRRGDVTQALEELRRQP